MATAVAPVSLTAQDLTQLRSITDEWVRVTLIRDFDSLTRLLTDDVVFLPPDAPVVVGKTAVRAFLDAFPAVTAFTAELDVAEGRPDLTWARGSFRMTVEPAPGQSASMVGKWSATYRKQDDGAWLCASDTWNLDAPATT